MPAAFAALIFAALSPLNLNAQQSAEPDPLHEQLMLWTRQRDSIKASRQHLLNEAETLLIKRALAETGGNIAEAARRLGVNRTRIYRKLGEKLGQGT